MTDMEQDPKVVDRGLMSHPVHKEENSTLMTKDCVTNCRWESESAEFVILRLLYSDEFPHLSVSPIPWVTKPIA